MSAQALRSGQVESVKKFAGGSNSQTSVQKNTAKLDAETDELSRKTCGPLTSDLFHTPDAELLKE